MTTEPQSIEAAYAKLGDSMFAEDIEAAARALAMAAHDDACLQCLASIVGPSAEYLAIVATRRSHCPKRADIAALGKEKP